MRRVRHRDARAYALAAIRAAARRHVKRKQVAPDERSDIRDTSNIAPDSAHPGYTLHAVADAPPRQENKSNAALFSSPTPFCSQRTNRSRANQRAPILNSAFASCSRSNRSPDGAQRNPGPHRPGFRCATSGATLDLIVNDCNSFMVALTQPLPLFCAGPSQRLSVAANTHSPALSARYSRKRRTVHRLAANACGAFIGDNQFSINPCVYQLYRPPSPSAPACCAVSC